MTPQSSRAVPPRRSGEAARTVNCSAAPAAIPTIPTLRAQSFSARNDLSLSKSLTAGQNVAFIDPDLDSDVSVGGCSFRESVIDIGAERVQRYLAIALMLAAGHLSPC